MLRHPATGLLIGTPLTLYAFYQGFAGRRDKEGKKKKLHAKLMPWVLGLTILSAYDGTCSMKAWDISRSLTSLHAITGAGFIAALIGQGIGSYFLNDENRNVHAYIGSATCLLFLAHVGTGACLYLEI